MKMKQIMMLLAAVLLTACSKDSEVKAATVQEAGKTLVVYYSAISDLKVSFIVIIIRFCRKDINFP